MMHNTPKPSPTPSLPPSLPHDSRDAVSRSGHESAAAEGATDSPGYAERPATLDQRRAIRILIAQAQLSDLDVERLLMARFSRPAVTQLSYGQAACLLRELQRKLHR